MTNQSSEQFPRIVFPDFCFKTCPFFLTKVVKKGSLSLNQDENGPFFPDQNWHKFHIVVKIIFTIFKSATFQWKISQLCRFQWLNRDYYLKDPPWLGPTRKILKIGIQKLAETIKFKAFLKEIPGNFPDFRGISRKIEFRVQPSQNLQVVWCDVKLIGPKHV